MDQSWLSTKYPFEQSRAEKRDTVLTLATIGSLVLIFLQPYGFSVSDQILHFMALFLIGVLTAGVNYFGLPYFFPDSFDEKKWSVLKAFVFLSYNFLIIGLWTHIYHVVFIKKNIFLIASGAELFESLVKTTLIGLTAAALFILFRYNVLARKHLQVSEELNLNSRLLSKTEQPMSGERQLEFLLEGKEVRVNRDELTYISAEGNYIRFHFKNEAKGSSHLYRATIKELEGQLQGFPGFFRCHRSFIINLNSIISSRGNSQGLFIKVDGKEDGIPVSRSKIKALRGYMAQVSETKKQFIT